MHAVIIALKPPPNCHFLLMSGVYILRGLNPQLRFRVESFHLQRWIAVYLPTRTPRVGVFSRLLLAYSTLTEGCKFGAWKVFVRRTPPPPLLSCSTEFMTLIKVCMCLCHKGHCRAQEEKGIVIELRVIEFTGVCGSNHLTFERVLSNRHALQFGWSISPTGLKVNGTNTDTPGREKTSPRTNSINAGFFGLLGVASGSPLVCMCHRFESG